MNNIEKELYSILITLAIAAGGILLGRIFYFITEKYLKKIFEKTETKIDDRIHESLSKYINPLFLFISFDIAFYSLNYYRIENIKKILIKGDEIILIFIAGMMVAKIVDIILDEIPEIEARRRNGKKNVAAVIPIFKNMGRIIVWMVMASMIIIKLGYSPISILTGMGIVGVAVSFAAQNTIANFLSGVFILFDGPFMIGDRIKVGEIVGDVVEIGIRTTRIQTPDNNIITVPNSNITSKEVTNYNKPGYEEKVFYNVSVSYGTDTEKTKEIIKNIIESTDGVILKYPVGVYLSKLGNYSLDFQAIFWINDFKDKMEVVDVINSRILEKFKKENIQIPYPVYDINIKNNEKGVK